VWVTTSAHPQDRGVSRERTSTKMLQPLIWLARSSTRYNVVSGIPACLAALPSSYRAFMTPGTVGAGLSIRACIAVLHG